ncbi:MAG TPA: type Z 30S ribosomal protein S14 [Candidatus Pacebacteria bacterium]|nr:MAG: 30S ribosomal protein S14 [Candidatus Pacebacteria bacterium RIFOXYB1_FULL_44_10]HAU99035.1 type Z 30S ribosomal protein S14 [Candidatus Paceibacterota bacterium]HAX01250.1 type Z 30S ribosomal protein S14 [Candidatus Paceibacterota bacterium]
MAKTSKIVKTNRVQKFSTRKMNRCSMCGRPRAYIRMFGVCRLCFRELAAKGELPGVMKASM